MTVNKKLNNLIGLLLMTTVLLASCKPSLSGSKENITETPNAEITEKAPDPTLEAPPEPLRICLINEPSSLYPYGDDNSAALAIREAIYDGPFDNLSYENYPVILQKMPSLADGDARINSVLVSEGDLVLSENRPRTLEAGLILRPSGCTSKDCEITYEEGEIEMDQMEVEFNLLPDLQWSDGGALTSADSIYAFALANHPDTPISKSKLIRTASYTSMGLETVVWVGIPGYLDPDYASNFWAPMPQHLWGKLSAAELLENEISTRSPIGWGAYMLEEWIPGQSILLKSNPNYFKANEGLPRVETLLFQFMGNDTSKNIDAILNGECDLLESSPDLYEQATDLIELQENGDILASFSSGKSWEVLDMGIHPSSYDDGYYTYLGDRPAFFSDLRTRQAIAYCIDRQNLVDSLHFGQSYVLDSYLPPQHPLFNPDSDQYPFDIEKGRTLLEQVGWVLGDNNVRIASEIDNIPDGTQFELSYWTTNGNLNHRLKAAEKISANLRSCGIKINLKIYSAEELYAKAPEGPLFGRNYDLVQYPWQISQTPACNLYISEGIAGDNFSFIYTIPWLTEALPDANPYDLAFPWAWGGWNSPGYANPAYDEACSSALAALPGMPEHEENHLLAQKIFSEDLPVIPLYLSVEVAAARPDICNFSLDPTSESEFWNIENIGYGEYCFGD